MRIRKPWLIKATGFSAAWAVRLWIGTLRYRYRPLGRNFEPQHLAPDERYIYAFWHENMLMPAQHYSRTDLGVLISQHADGQLIAEVCRHLGFHTVRGSTARDGVRAVRQMLQMDHGRHLAITPDGPRGPRRQVQPGIVYVAAKTGMPIVPFGFAFDRPWRARSWDRFAMPRPWSLATCVTDDRIVVPPDASRAELEDHRRGVEEMMLRVTDVAERIAAGRRRAA
jgi:lysophospholipid acyltransferase (LPLAT)-like uncharacterized protein